MPMILLLLAAPAPAEPPPLPADIVKGWSKENAVAGWMGPQRKPGPPVFHPDLKALDASRTVPAFGYGRWAKRGLSAVPAPGRAFGLDLAETDIADDELRAVGRFHHLAILDVSGTKITDEGLRHL